MNTILSVIQKKYPAIRATIIDYFKWELSRFIEDIPSLDMVSKGNLCVQSWTVNF